MASGFARLESVNFPGRYIRHQNFRGVLTPIVSDLDKKDSTFSHWAGLAGFGASFEAVNFPGMFLRHWDFKLILARNDGSSQFAQDATFYDQRLSDLGYSWEAANFSGYFLRELIERDVASKKP